jgi:hypothetical protein
MDDDRGRGSLSTMRWLLIAGVAALLVFTGCGRSSDAATQLGELEAAFDASASPVPEAAAMAPDAPVEAGVGPADSPQAYVNRAVAAVRAGEPAEGVMLLQTLQQTTGMNAQERMAVQKTIRAVTADLVRRAADGDPHAQTELKRIERFLSVR